MKLASEERLLKLNSKKTKYLVLQDNTNFRIHINGEDLDEVDHFNYLGSEKTKNGECSLDIRCRIAMAKQRTLELENILKDHGMRMKVKMMLLKSLARSIVTYGAEGWTLRKADEDRINAAELWLYRRLLRVSWRERRTNASILADLGVRRQLLATIKRRKLLYFGHVSRPSGCQLIADIISGRFPLPRKRGRPKP